MFFDFCVGPAGASGPPCGLDTIFWIWGDGSYQTPHKGITPGKTYLVFTLKGEGLIRYDGRAYRGHAPHARFRVWLSGGDVAFLVV